MGRFTLPLMLPVTVAAKLSACLQSVARFGDTQRTMDAYIRDLLNHGDYAK